MYSPGITPQHTASAIVGAGALADEWVHVGTPHGIRQYAVPADWFVHITVTAEVNGQARVVSACLDHGIVAATLSELAGLYELQKVGEEPEGIHGLSAEALQRIRRFTENPDGRHIDRATAGQVIQYIALGEVIY